LQPARTHLFAGIDIFLLYLKKGTVAALLTFLRASGVPKREEKR
jgi:hypothetical protein